MKYHRHKFNAVSTKRNGMHFPSKKEARYYDHVCALVKAGQILFFLRQVPFHLPGNVKMVVDFLEFHSDGSVHVVDVKGHKTKQYIDKKKMVEAIYPVEIEEV